MGRYWQISQRHDMPHKVVSRRHSSGALVALNLRAVLLNAASSVLLGSGTPGEQ
jgi:hypothetical protein